MQLLPGRRGAVRRDVELAHDAHDLLVDVLPLAHPPVVEEILATEPMQLRARAAIARFAPRAPELEVPGEVAAVDAELLVRLIRLLLHRLRPVARKIGRA